MAANMEPPVEPVKIVLSLRAAGGDMGALESWVRELLATTSETVALQGSSVLTEGERAFVLLRFAAPADRVRWQSSPRVAGLLRRGESFVAREDPIERTGLETWFALPGAHAAARVPPKWKMALVTFAALVPQIVAVTLLLPKMPLVLSVCVTTAITVSALTWIIMPRLTRWLARWLYPKEISA